MLREKESERERERDWGANLSERSDREIREDSYGEKEQSEDSEFGEILQTLEHNQRIEVF